MDNEDQQLIALYQKTRHQQPSAQLDKLILSAAKNKLAAHKNSFNFKAKAQPKKWIWALSSVAVVVLSVNVALKLVVEPIATAPAYAPPITHEKSLIHSNESFNEVPAQARFLSLQNANNERRHLAKKKAMQQSKMAERKQAKATLPKQHSKKLKIMSIEAKKETALLAMDAFSDNAKTDRQTFERQIAHKKGSNALIVKQKSLSAPLPFFPFNIKDLSLKYPSLNIKKTPLNQINIVSSGVLILSLNRLNDGFVKVSAYPQKNQLKLNINWALKAQCSPNLLPVQCAINKQLTGTYSNNQLIKVTWRQ